MQFSKRKFTIESVKRNFEKYNYQIIDCPDRYQNVRQRFCFICPNGHKGSVIWNNWLRGARCKQCNLDRRRKCTIKDIQQAFAEEGYTLINIPNIYKNNRQYFEYLCPAQHKARITWSDWQQGYRCRQCGIERRAKKNRKYTIADVELSLCKEGYQLLTSEAFKNSHQQFEYLCPKKHRSTTTWSEWKKGYRCKYCAGRAIGFDQIEEIARSRGVKILSTKSDYQNCYSKILVACPINQRHIYKVTWTNFQQGSGCPKCSHSQSKGELEIVEYLKSKRVYVIERDRSILGGKELDIFCPDKEWVEKIKKRQE